MVEVKKLTPELLAALDPQTSQADTMYVMEDAGPRLYEHGYAYMDGDEVVAIFGIVPIWYGRSVSYVVMNNNVGTRHLGLTRAIIRTMDRYQKEDPDRWRRFEAHCNMAFPESVAFARLTGYEVEGLMKHFGLDGHDHMLMSRIA